MKQPVDQEVLAVARSPQPLPPADDGLLIVGHGTDDPAGNEQLRETAQFIAACCRDRPTEAAFLERARPTIAQGIARLARRGARRIVVAPLLLFASGHAKRDIPRAVAAALARHPGITARQIRPPGCHPRIMQLSALRYAEALAGHRFVPGHQTALLLVGRGGSDREATRQMHRLARLRARDLAPVQVHTCFLAVATPSFDDALTRLAEAHFSRVVVQPHLFFQGRLLARMHAGVAAAAAKTAGSQWLVAAPLGPAPLLAQAILELAYGATLTKGDAQ